MGYFAYQGKKIYYEETGAGEPLLLLHGNTLSGRMFGPIVPYFAARYRVIVPDFLGCGRSDRLEQWPADLWYDWGRQAAALCREKGLEKVLVIGSSGGALAALNLALEAPELVRAVIADSFEGLRADGTLTEQICMGRTAAKQMEGFRAMMQSLHGEDWEQVVDADTDAVIRHAASIGSFLHSPISELRTRLLLTGSAEDEMFPRGHYKKLFGEICAQTPMARSHIFPRGNHPALGSNPEEFLSLAAEFFAP